MTGFTEVDKETSPAGAREVAVDRQLLKEVLVPCYLVIAASFAGFSLMLTRLVTSILDGEFSEIADSDKSTCEYMVGVLLSVYPAGQLIGSPIMGDYIDRWGRKRVWQIIITGLACSYLAITVAVALESLTLLMVAVFFAGLCEVNVPLVQAILADTFSGAQLTHYFGFVFVFGSAAHVFGALVGAAAGGTRALPFAIVTGCQFLAASTVFLLYRETLAETKRRKGDWKQSLLSVLDIFQPGPLRPRYFTNLLADGAVFGYLLFLPLFVEEEHGFDADQVSMVIATAASPFVLANLLLTRFLARNFDAVNVATTMAVGMCVLQLGALLPVGDGVGVYTLVFLTSIPVSLIQPPLGALLVARAGPGEAGRVMGNNQALQKIAEIIFANLNSAIINVWIAMPLAVAAFFSLATAAFNHASAKWGNAAAPAPGSEIGSDRL